VSAARVLRLAELDVRRLKGLDWEKFSFLPSDLSAIYAPDNERRFFSFYFEALTQSSFSVHRVHSR